MPVYLTKVMVLLAIISEGPKMVREYDTECVEFMFADRRLLANCLGIYMPVANTRAKLSPRTGQW